MSFFHIDMTQVVEILSQVRQEPIYYIQSISWVLMSWCGTEPRPCKWRLTLKPSDVIWRHKSGSTLAGVMACFLAAQSHYMKIVDINCKVQWYLPEGNFTKDISSINHRNQHKNYLSTISLKFSMGQRVKLCTVFSLRSQPHIHCVLWNFIDFFLGAQLTISQHWFR